MPITTAMLRWFTSATYIDNTSQEISAKDVRDGFNLVADAIDTAVATTVGADPETVKDWADAAALLAISAQDSAALASTKATEAAASATGSLANKNAAASSATTSTTKAAEAAASAADAQTSKNSAASSATTSTTKAAEAAASAAAALTSQNSAASSATTSTTKAAEATTAATTATTKASEAATSAALAASAVTTVGGRNPKIGNMSVTDNTINSGNYHYDSANGSSGGPAGSTYGHITHYRRAAGGGEAQVFIFENPTSIHIRSRTTGAWNTWTKLAFDTYPTVFATVVEFKAAIAASIYSGVPSGFSVTAGGTTYIRDATFTGIPGLSGWRQPWMKQKHLLSADWQPRPYGIDTPSAPSEVPRLQSTMNSIAARHPDLTHAHLLGDLVHEGTIDVTGAQGVYSFKELLADWRLRLPIPLTNLYMIAGNHDRDGTPVGSFREAKSLQTYRSNIGAEFYYTLQGNLLNIYAGDMGGTTGGAISNAVVAWMGQVIRSNRNCNIFINIHQPIAGTYRGTTEVSDATMVQSGSQRLVDILNEANSATGAKNICAVFYGHVGSSYQFNDETWFGTRHIQIGMHIPSNVTYARLNPGQFRPDHYYVMHVTHGATAIPIQQWDATNDVLLTTKNVALKFPLQLADGLDFDGRTQVEMSTPRPVAQSVVLPMDDYRKDLGAGWVVPIGTKLWGYKIRVEDRSEDTVLKGLEVGYGIDFPGSQVSGGLFDKASVESVAVEGLGITWTKLNDSELEPHVGVSLYGAAKASRKLMLRMNPENPPGDTGIEQEGLHILTGKIRVSSDDPAIAPKGNLDFASQSFAGFQANQNGITQIGTNGLAGLRMQRSGSNGTMADFYKGNSSVGTISVTTTSTAYNTTSDKRLKCDWQEFDGLSTIMALEVWDHAWIDQDHRAKGVLAQDAALVAPYAVSEGDDETPWVVDYSKFVPDLIRAVQQLSTRVEELEGAANGK